MRNKENEEKGGNGWWQEGRGGGGGEGGGEVKGSEEKKRMFSCGVKKMREREVMREGRGENKEKGGDGEEGWGKKKMGKRVALGCENKGEGSGRGVGGGGGGRVCVDGGWGVGVMWLGGRK